jgi:hypothetical protein
MLLVYRTSNTSDHRTIALNNCQDKNELFVPKCNAEDEIGIVNIVVVLEEINK